MEFIDDRVRRMGLGRHVIDGLMPIGIERLADRLQRRDALRAQEIYQRTHRHLDPVNDRLGVGAAACSRQRALEIVDNRQEVTENRLALDPNGFLALLADSLAGIFRVGQNAQILVL